MKQVSPTPPSPQHSSNTETFVPARRLVAARRFCVKSMLHVGMFTLLSRCLGFVREMLLIRSLGKGALSDAFLTAFRLPNLLYKVCAGGALSPAVVPVAVRVMRHEGQAALGRFMTALLATITCGLACLCALIIWQAPWVVRCMAPGFDAVQAAHAIFLSRCMITFVLFTTMSALISEALRIARHFAIPALGQAIFNVVFIGALVAYWYGAISIGALALAVVAGGIVQLIPHVWMYGRRGFAWGLPTAHAWTAVRDTASSLIPSATTASMVELGTFVEMQLASYLPVGSISLLSYSAIFLHMPLGIFATAFSTVIFPDMVRVSHYAPRRLGYLVCEAAKLVCWVLVPCSILMAFFAYDIFSTLYRSATFTEDAIVQASWLLVIRACALVPLALNKFLLNAFYALRDLRIPSAVSLGGTCVTIALSLLLMPQYGMFGLAAAGSVVAYGRLFALLWFLHARMPLGRYRRSMTRFARALIWQLISVGGVAGVLFGAIRYGLSCSQLPYAAALNGSCLMWVWIGVLGLAGARYAWTHRRALGMKIYYLDR